MKGKMAANFIKKDMTIQQIAPYAHQQAGKIECYV
jgi:hypothetical protein